MRVTAEQLQALLPTEDTGMFTIEELLGNPGDFEFSAEDLDENDLPDL